MVRSDVAAGDSRVVKGVDSQATPAQRITSLTASRDVVVMQRVIRERYGFLPSPDYCLDLIAFVEDLTDGQQQQPRRPA